MSISKEELDRLIKQGMTIGQLSQALDVSLSTVKRKLNDFGLKTEVALKYADHNHEEISKETLEALISDGLSTNGIAKSLSCSQCKVRRWLSKYGIKTNGAPRVDCKCDICGKQLEGKQIKFCSTKCCNVFHQGYDGNYDAQKRRGSDRKKQLIDQLGGKCVSCGYDKNIAALEFHHKDPSDKAMKMDVRHLSNHKWETILEEAKKCDVMCANCHRELHHTDLIDY